MDYRILGPLEVRGERDALPLGGGKPRSVLAVLLLHANEPVSADRLALALWGADAPAAAAKTVQVHVSRVRKALGDAALVETTPAGYRLRVRPGELDVERFERGVADGRRALAAGRAEEAAALLREALSAWRGPPLADLAFEPFAPPAIARLEELRLAALEARVDADLAAGRHAALVGELRELVAEHPARERLAGQLMVALYRAGRQTEALDAYRDARRALVDEVGVEPGPELQRLHRAVLEHDPSLDLAPAARELPLELDAAAAPPLVGRDVEVARLRARWERARAGSGGLVALCGADGMGKTRLAAELAAAAHDDGAVVRFATGRDSAAAIAAALDGLAPDRPVLVVVDDADRAEPRAAAALSARAADAARARALVLATGGDASALAALGADEVLELAPLDADAVRRIARQAVPGNGVVDVPVAELLAASGGVPVRVHDVVTEWARREAARRVDVAAGGTAAGRARLRSEQTELTLSVLALQAAEERARLPGEADAGVVCPFKGLASFDVADAPYFFGRERLVAELVAKLVGAPLLGVVGPSGSGKSSVVRAGLLPALREGVLPDSDTWTQVLMRPGEHPLAELRRVTTGVGHDDRVLIAVDQFEETFTACRDEDERRAFISELAGDHDGRRVVVLAIRADHYGRCARYAELSGKLSEHHVLVGAMRRDELRRAVERPSARVGLRVDPELVDALVSEVEYEPGALPMLSTALLELWQRRDGRHLRLSTYEAAGGVRGAVARHAEQAFARLDPAQQELARRVLLRLVADDGAGGVERRRVPLAALGADTDGAVGGVVDVLADQRLLTLSAGAVELAHEALLREWPRLRGWLEQDTDGRRLRQHLTVAAREWEERGRDPGELYRGARLAAAQEWRAAHEPELTASEQAFLDAARAEADAARARRRRSVTLAFAALVVITGISVVVAVRGVVRARADARADASRVLATRAVARLGDDVGLASLLGLEAWRREPTVEARSAALAALPALGDYRRIGRPLAHASPVGKVAISPDGRVLAAAVSDGTVQLWDLAARRRLGAPLRGHTDAVTDMAFSPDGALLVTGGFDRTIRLWDVAARRPLGGPLDAPQDVVDAVAFSPDGRTLASAGSDVQGVESATVTLWDLSTRRPKGRSLTVPDQVVYELEFSPDGSLLAGAGTLGFVRLWNVASRRPVARPPLGDGRTSLFALALSPDGETVASGGLNTGEVRLWDVRSGRAIGRPLESPDRVNALAFSPDGARLAVAMDGGSVQLWNAATQRLRGVLLSDAAGSTAPGRTDLAPNVLSVAFTPDGDVLASAGDDGAVVLWDVGARNALARPLHGHRGSVRGVAFASDSTLVSGGVDGGVRLWDAAAGRPLGRPLPDAGQVLAVAANADRGIVAASADDGTVRLWDAASGRVLGAPLMAHRSAATAVALSPDGETLATGARDGTVRLWDVESRRPRGAPLRPGAGAIHAVAIGDGGIAAAAAQDGTVRLWDLDDRKPLGTLTGPTGLLDAVAFSPDGDTLAAAGLDGSVWLWDVDARTPLDQPLAGHAGLVTGVAFSPDGRTLASTGDDGTVRLWDVAGRRALGAPLAGHPGGASAVAFSPDGRHLASAGRDGTIRVWNPILWSADRDAVERRVCAVVRRSLTRDEWARFVPDAPYHATCAAP